MQGDVGRLLRPVDLDEAAVGQLVRAPRRLAQAERRAQQRLAKRAVAHQQRGVAWAASAPTARPTVHAQHDQL